jgi:hypothetical protein
LSAEYVAVMDGSKLNLRTLILQFRAIQATQYSSVSLDKYFMLLSF